jgi:hypothetical protein
MTAKQVAETPQTRASSVKLQVLVGVVAGLLLLVTTFSYWARNNIYNTQRFTAQITAAVEDPATREAIGAEVASNLYKDRPIAGRLLTKPTESLISSLLTNDRFSGILDNLATRLSERLIHGRNNPVVIDVSGFSSGITAIATIVAPDTQISLPTGEDAKIVLLRADAVPNLQPSGRVVLAVAPLALLSLAVLTIVSWFKSRSKLEFLKVAGIVLLSTGVILLLLLSTATAQLALMAQNANQATILESIYTQFTDSLQTYTYGLMWAGTGLIALSAIITHRTTIVGFFKNAWSRIPRKAGKT